MNKILYLVLVLMLFAGVILPKKMAVLSEINNPFKFRVDNRHFYISDGIKVFVFSLNDYKLLKKFGKEGEGPGEILLDRNEGNTQVALHIEENQIIVRSMTKLIYFTKEGKYLKELKTITAGKWLCPFNDGFVGKKYVSDKNGLMNNSVFYYDAGLKQIREIYSQKNGWQGPQKPFNPLLTKGAKFEIEKEKLFVMDSLKTCIKAFDKNGNKLMEISHNDKPVPFTEKDKMKMVKDYKTKRIWKMLYETRKHFFKFPKFFTLINDFELDNGEKTIYMASEKIEDQKRKWFVFDMNGKQLRELFLPLEGKYQFHNGRGYRLFENENEKWEFHYYDLKNTEI